MFLRLEQMLQCLLCKLNVRVKYKQYDYSSMQYLCARVYMYKPVLEPVSRSVGETDKPMAIGCSAFMSTVVGRYM